MLRLTVIGSEIAAASIAAACSMPARKLGGAARAAASYKRSNVRPPDVMATAELAAPRGSLELVGAALTFNDVEESSAAMSDTPYRDRNS